MQALVRKSDNLCEFWHMSLEHLDYRDLLIMRGIVIGLPNFIIE
jgi:hypothetical protein